MRFFLISDNNDTAVGMRLAGVSGVVVHGADEVICELDKAMLDPDIGVVMITEQLMKLCSDDINTIKLTRQFPLIVGIPDRHGNGGGESEISRYVREAIGISI